MIAAGAALLAFCVCMASASEASEKDQATGKPGTLVESPAFSVVLLLACLAHTAYQLHKRGR